MARELTQGFVFKHRQHWRAAVNWRDEDGRRRRLTKSTKIRCYPDKVDERTGEVTPDNRGKAKAEAFLRKWRDELVAEDLAAEERRMCSTTPFAEYVGNYIDERARSGAVSDVTIKGYRSHLMRLMGTELGNAPLCDVTPKLIIAWEASLAEDGLSGSTLSHIHVFAKQVCTHARKVGDLAANPFDLVDAPKRRPKPINSLDAQGVARMNEALAGFGPSPMATAAKIALMTGMRQGEICALRWRDVDMDARVIRVSHALTRVNGRYAIGDPKTGGSARSIPFGESLRRGLEARRAAMEADLAEFGEPWDDSLFVIGSAYDGSWRSPQVLGHEWHAFARAAGLVGTQGEPPRFHDLRHTFATLAIASGVDVKTVSAILGHANAAMTLNVYADALADSKKAGMERMDRLLSQ